MSGDITMGSTGVTAIGSGKVTNAMLAGSITYNKLTGPMTFASSVTAQGIVQVNGNFISGAAGYKSTNTAATGSSAALNLRTTLSCGAAAYTLPHWSVSRAVTPVAPTGASPTPLTPPASWRRARQGLRAAR